MPFGTALRRSLQDRRSELATEFMRGDSLEEVLNRHLLTVEQLGAGEMSTCILLLNEDGKSLSYGAAPTVPASYSQASDRIEIGPRAGSCGAAAYLGRPVYSVDIAADPVWGSSRELALAHGFKACWSTPIRNSEGSIIGTFAILRRKVGKPTQAEIEAIDMIIEHVADAIMWSRELEHIREADQPHSAAPLLRLVASNEEPLQSVGRLLELVRKLESKAAELDRHASQTNSDTYPQSLSDAAELSRNLARIITAQVEQMRSGKMLP
jgi:GAF domain-containing protein